MIGVILLIINAITKKPIIEKIIIRSLNVDLVRKTTIDYMFLKKILIGIIFVSFSVAIRLLLPII